MVTESEKYTLDYQRNTGSQSYEAVVRVKRGPALVSPPGLITRPVQTALLNQIDGTPQPISQLTLLNEQGTFKMVIALIFCQCSSDEMDASNHMISHLLSLTAISPLADLTYYECTCDTAPNRLMVMAMVMCIFKKGWQFVAMMVMQLKLE